MASLFTGHGKSILVYSVLLFLSILFFCTAKGISLIEQGYCVTRCVHSPLQEQKDNHNSISSEKIASIKVNSNCRLPSRFREPWLRTKHIPLTLRFCLLCWYIIISMYSEQGLLKKNIQDSKTNRLRNTYSSSSSRNAIRTCKQWTIGHHHRQNHSALYEPR